jgi:hypothetical protein
MGESEGPLDLYLILGRSTAAYTTIRASARGTAFELSGPAERMGEEEEIRVDLVSGAVVWYTVAATLAIRATGSDTSEINRDGD